ncbi:hypothetical protein TSOC_008562 [Tetrabaena socialis]|uniref:Uncharacterized protein n=1 Tax=Tetrabaena socialis TaxID=47790 RepID=A0A2J7ZY70_9CHLO|nr:hypothetical protein TSOC_008562 [Tetrabaena socialis]|eukprot:PNH05206.1 hypothetical protein TSOC_008562 [Tetrabaena socialis]
MNFWYSPALAAHDALELQPGRGLPREVIAAVAAESRSTSELEAVRARAHSACEWDMASAAHVLLVARRNRESADAMRAVRAGQAAQQLQQEEATASAVGTVSGMWGTQLEQLRWEGEAAVRALQERHEDALNRLRIDQVTRAQEKGVRTERRSTVLLNLRRSEAVLAAKQEYADAFKVKVRADALADDEASDAHMDWLLKCHAEQQQLNAKQAKQVEALRKRLSDRLRDAEAARDRDLQRLGRKIEVATTCQQRTFKRERQHLVAAQHGNMLNTRTTRLGKGLADAFPTLAALSPGAATPNAAASFAWTELSAALGSGYLPLGTSAAGAPGTSAAGAASGRPNGGARHAQGVRFAPTPLVREAWPAGGPVSSSNGSSTAAAASSSSTSASSASLSSQTSSGPSGRGDRAPPPAAKSVKAAAAVGPVGVAASSIAMASGTSAGATGSGSSALTEAALQEINRAHKARPGIASLQSSSFKSARPYAAGLSARVLKRV